MGRTTPKALKAKRKEEFLESNAALNPYVNYHKQIREVSKPSGKMTYGITWTKNRTPVFVGVSFADKQNKLFRFEREKKKDNETHRWKCRDCSKTMSANSKGNISHGLSQRKSDVDADGDPKPCDELNDDRLADCILAVRCWAAFQAELEAKAEGRETFDLEDWEDWMKKAGQSAPVSPSEERWIEIKDCVKKCCSQLEDILTLFVQNIRDGQKLVHVFNQKPSWQCQVQKN
jgi:hypothetical protein